MTKLIKLQSLIMTLGLIIISNSLCFSQDVTKGVDFAREYTGISMHIGGVLPIGSFARENYYSDLGENSLLDGAAFGASFGLKFSYGFQNTEYEDLGLNVYLSIDAIWNNVCKEYKSFYEALNKTHHQYINIPILIGANYTYSLGNKGIVALYGQAGLGVDFFKHTQEGWATDITKYDLVYNFAAEAAIGVIFVQQYSLGIHYNFLGNQKLKIQGMTYAGDDNDNNSNNNNNNSNNDNTESNAIDYSAKMQMSTFSIKLGYHF